MANRNNFNAHAAEPRGQSFNGGAVHMGGSRYSSDGFGNTNQQLRQQINADNIYGGLRLAEFRQEQQRADIIGGEISRQQRQEISRENYIGGEQQWALKHGYYYPDPSLVGSGLAFNTPCNTGWGAQCPVEVFAGGGRGRRFHGGFEADIGGFHGGFGGGRDGLHGNIEVIVRPRPPVVVEYPPYGGGEYYPAQQSPQYSAPQNYPQQSYPQQNPLQQNPPQEYSQQQPVSYAPPELPASSANQYPPVAVSAAPPLPQASQPAPPPPNPPAAQPSAPDAPVMNDQQKLAAGQAMLEIMAEKGILTGRLDRYGVDGLEGHWNKDGKGGGETGALIREFNSVNNTQNAVGYPDSARFDDVELRRITERYQAMEGLQQTGSLTGDQNKLTRQHILEEASHLQVKVNPDMLRELGDAGPGAPGNTPPSQNPPPQGSGTGQPTPPAAPSQASIDIPTPLELIQRALNGIKNTTAGSEAWDKIQQMWGQAQDAIQAERTQVGHTPAPPLGTPPAGGPAPARGK